MGRPGSLKVNVLGLAGQRSEAQGRAPLAWATVRGTWVHLSPASPAHARLDCPGGQDASPGTSGASGPLGLAEELEEDSWAVCSGPCSSLADGHLGCLSSLRPGSLAVRTQALFTHADWARSLSKNANKPDRPRFPFSLALIAAWAAPVCVRLGKEEHSAV